MPESYMVLVIARKIFSRFLGRWYEQVPPCHSSRTPARTRSIPDIRVNLMSIDQLGGDGRLKSSDNGCHKNLFVYCHYKF